MYFSSREYNIQCQGGVELHELRKAHPCVHLPENSLGDSSLICVNNGEVWGFDGGQVVGQIPETRDAM